MRQYLNLPWVLKKKNLILVSNLFIKIKPRPISGKAGRVLEKTHPIVIPTSN